MFFSLIFGGVLGSVFLRFGGRSVPNGGYLGTLFQPCCSKAGKLETRVSCTPNTTFQSFEGLGQDVLGNFFQHLFWDGFWDVISDFLRNWGSSRSSKDDFWWAFQGHILRWFFMYFQGVPQIPRRARVGGDYGVSGALNNRLLTTEGRHPSRSHMKDGCW